MTQPYPAALVISSLESVSYDNNVLYRLVKPLADGSGVESTDRLVNVVPHRRTYCFERKEQLETFSDEILRRPLVIQPVLHFGRGLGPCCGACYSDESWVVMINQTHPKILGRLQMGLELARSAVSKGHSLEIKFRFGKLIERIYREHLQQKESGEAESKTGLQRAIARTLLQFRYVEWEHGDLTLRSHGLAAKVTSTRLMLEMDASLGFKNIEKEWDFEDVGMHDMVWNQWQPELVFPRPNLAPVSEDEIRAVLPGWTINAVTPLEAIGETAPVRTYSYAQAGRLYASFRKARKSHDNHPHQNKSTGADNWAPQGAEATPDHWAPHGAEATPDHWAPHGAEARPDHWVDRENGAISTDFYPVESETNRKTARKDTPEYNSLDILQRDHDQNQYEYAQFDYGTKEARTQNERQTFGLPLADRYGHIVPQVHIQQPVKPSDSIYHLHKQDSDRSSRSTNADSGYCPGTDDGGQRSRGGSYDLNDDIAGSKGFTSPSLVNHKYESKSNNDLCSPSLHGPYTLANKLSNGNGMEGGVENPAFTGSMDKDLDCDKALQDHRQFVKRVLAKGLNGNSYTSDTNNYPNELTVPPRQLPTRSESASSVGEIAESFI